MDADRAAIGAETRKRLIRRLARHGAAVEDVEDAVQEAIVAFLGRPCGAPAVVAVESWLLRVAQRRLIDRQRKDRRLQPAELAENHSRALLITCRGDSGLDADYLGIGLTSTLAETLQLLTHGLGATEIAGRLGIGRWAAYKRIQRVRALLRTRLAMEKLDPG